jgi:predicted dehydrogenase
VDDTAFVAIDHASGVRSRLWTSLIASHVGPRLRLRGTGGEYLKDDLDAQEGQLLAGMLPSEPGFGAEPPERWGRLVALDGSVRQIQTEQGRYLPFYERLRDAIRGDGAIPVDPVDSLRVLRVLEAAERAGASGAAETMDEGRTRT